MANFDSFYREHNSWLRSVLFRRLGNADDAADLAHDAFIRLLVKPRRLDNIKAERGYLSAVARGLCVDLWRRQEIERAWLETLAHYGEVEVPSAERKAEAIQALSEVDNMLRKLPNAVASAFMLSMIHGLTGKEIAKRLGVSDRTVRNYLSRAMFECLRLQLRMEGKHD